MTSRQLEIIGIVKEHEPITGDSIAEMLDISRTTIRSDLSILVMLGLLNAKPKVGYLIGKRASEEGQVSAVLGKIKVKDVQSMPVIVRETVTVNDAVITLFIENVGSLIVTDEEGNLQGIISRKDLLKVTLGNTNPASIPVSMVMTRQPNIITVTPEESVIDAAGKMIRHQVDSLPVVESRVDENNVTRLEIVGRVTKSTMTRVLLDIATQG